MPDPNLGVLRLSEKRIETIRSTLPELPWITRSRLKETYALSDRDVDVLLNIDSGRDVRYDGEDPGETGAVKYFDRLVENAGSSTKGTRRDPKVVANWMTHELLGQLASQKMTFRQSTISSAQLGQLIDMVQQKMITGTTGKQLIRHMLSNPTTDPPSKIAENLELLAFSPSRSSASSVDSTPPESDTGDPLIALCETAIISLPLEVAAARNGNKNVLNKIVGSVMKQSRGRADARRVREIVEELIYREG